MGWVNIYRRRLRVFTVALMIYFDYKGVQKKARRLNRVKKNALWEEAHIRNATRVLNLMIELEGLWVKLGQYLSTRGNVLPVAYRNLLRSLQDSVPSRPLKKVRQTIEKELGKSIDELFTKFVEVPLAAASIGQVHRATLKDGREVVVKVQHDGIKEVILEDLKSAKSLVGWVAWAEPQCDLNPMIDELSKETPKELDFNHEAENTRTVSKNLNGKSEHDSTNRYDLDILIPEVIMSSEKVLVLQYMDGIRLNDSVSLEAYQVDKQKLVEEITRAYAHQIYVDGFFNGDPHPGNFLVSKEPPHRPILLDFGLTKSISTSMKQALAKMFLACVEGNHVQLLSAFTQMGLKLRVDMPEQIMYATTIFFSGTIPENEELENVKSSVDERERNLKAYQEKESSQKKKEVQYFNPIDAFPGDAVTFIRVLNLLQGLSSTMNVRIVYMDIMRPFAESTLLGGLRDGPAMDTKWIYDSPVHSDVETKLRRHLVELGSNKILGIQVCAYKEGHVIIDTAAGLLGQYDPQPVQPDSLFPVFSVTKGITAGMVHWLVDKGKLKLAETIANIWPAFRTRGKDLIKVHHVLNHTSGLPSAMGDVMLTNPFLLCDWKKCLQHIAGSIPETEPGSHQQYHYLSFGWLCGGLIEHASGKTFQEVLEEAIVHPLGIEGELYIGIPPGVESRLATLALDTEDVEKLMALRSIPGPPSSFLEGNIMGMLGGLPVLFNTLSVRRAIIPAANGHMSARALARYYATLAAEGVVPPPHSSLSLPPLGSHVHTPKFPPPKIRAKRSITDLIKRNKKIHTHDVISTSDDQVIDPSTRVKKIFSNPKIHDQFMGVGDYGNLAIPDGQLGLGFSRYKSSSGRMASFGHSGIGGSTGYCDVENDFAIAVTVNKLSLGSVTRSIIQLVCSELNLPLPDEFSDQFGVKGPDMLLKCIV